MKVTDVDCNKTSLLHYIGEYACDIHDTLAILAMTAQTCTHIPLLHLPTTSSPRNVLTITFSVFGKINSTHRNQCKKLYTKLRQLAKKCGLPTQTLKSRERLYLGLSISDCHGKQWEAVCLLMTFWELRDLSRLQKSRLHTWTTPDTHTW